MAICVSGDPCNALEIRADGLWAFGDDTDLPGASFICFNGQTGQIGSPIPFGPLNYAGPFCTTLTNPSTCKTLRAIATVFESVGYGRQGGLIRVGIERNLNGGLFAQIATAAIFSNQPDPDVTQGATDNIGTFLDTGYDIAPGASLTICVRLTVEGGPLDTGQVFSSAGCLVITPTGWVDE